MPLFRPATRQKSKLRMAIDGPSGAGKTFTSLRMATAIAQATGGKICVLSSEFGDAEKYLGLSPDGTPWTFDIAYPTDFSPTTYTRYILAGGQEGYSILVIDSLSHAWSGEGGALELKDKKGGNSFTAWKDITPMHNRMIEAIKRSPCHVIATMRSKTEYILEADANGKQVPRKVGMAPVQRPGMEYEFDVYAAMDWSHTMTITKSRCSVIDGLVVVKPDMAVMEPVLKWLNEGVDAPAGYYTATEADLIKHEAANKPVESEADKVARRRAEIQAAAKANSTASGTANGAAATPPTTSTPPAVAGPGTATEPPKKRGRPATKTAKDALADQLAERMLGEAEAKLEACKVAEVKLMAGQTVEYRMAGSEAKANGGAATATKTTKKTATHQQVNEVRDLVALLAIDHDKLTAILAKAGVAKVSDLPAEACNILIGKLQAKLDQKKQQAEAAGKN